MKPKLFVDSPPSWSRQARPRPWNAWVKLRNKASGLGKVQNLISLKLCACEFVNFAGLSEECMFTIIGECFMWEFYLMIQPLCTEICAVFDATPTREGDRPRGLLPGISRVLPEISHTFSRPSPFSPVLFLHLPTHPSPLFTLSQPSRPLPCPHHVQAAHIRTSIVSG